MQALAVATTPLTAPPQPCIAADPTCPCQDGDMCHYHGPQAWPVQPQSALARLARLQLYPEQKHEEFDAVYTPQPLLSAPPPECKWRVKEDVDVRSKQDTYPPALRVPHQGQVVHTPSRADRGAAAAQVEVVVAGECIPRGRSALRGQRQPPQHSSSGGKPSARRGAFLCNCVDPKLRKASRKARPKNYENRRDTRRLLAQAETRSGAEPKFALQRSKSRGYG